VINPKAPIRSCLVTRRASPQVSLYDISHPFCPAYRSFGARPEGTHLLPPISFARVLPSDRISGIKDLGEKSCPNRDKYCADGRATPGRPWASGTHPSSRRRPGQPPCCWPRPYQDFAGHEPYVPPTSSKADQNAPQPH